MWREICLNNFVKMYLPFTAEIIVLEEPYKKLAIFYCDLDKDGIKEIVAAYTWQGENYIIVLKNQYNSWYMVENKKTNNYREILSNSYKSFVAIDEEKQEIVGFINVISDGVLTAYIPLLEVIPGYKNKGIGGDLVKMAMEEFHDFYMIDIIVQ